MSIYVSAIYYVVCDKCQRVSGFSSQSITEARNLGITEGWRSYPIRTNKHGADVEDLCYKCEAARELLKYETRTANNTDS